MVGGNPHDQVLKLRSPRANNHVVSLSYLSMPTRCAEILNERQNRFKTFGGGKLLPCLAGLDCQSPRCRCIHKSSSRIINKQLYYFVGTYDAFVIGKASGAKASALFHNLVAYYLRGTVAGRLGIGQAPTPRLS